MSLKEYKDILINLLFDDEKIRDLSSECWREFGFTSLKILVVFFGTTFLFYMLIYASELGDDNKEIDYFEVFGVAMLIPLWFLIVSFLFA